MVFLFFYLSQAWVEGSLFFFLGDIGGFPMPGVGWPALFGPVVWFGPVFLSWCGLGGRGRTSLPRYKPFWVVLKVWGVVLVAWTCSRYKPLPFSINSGCNSWGGHNVRVALLCAPAAWLLLFFKSFYDQVGVVLVPSCF